jgi:plastocyanin
MPIIDSLKKNGGMLYESKTNITHIGVGVVIAILITAILSFPTNFAFAQVDQQQQQQQQLQPNIKASSIYQTHTMVLGKNIKNLVIEIPNEGHEMPNAMPRDLRVVNQPYLPQNAVVNVGTTVTWFNADAGHHHQITLVNNNSKKIVSESGLFNNFTAPKPIRFNDTGAFAYSGPSFDKGAPNYKMNGTITVVNQPLSTSFNSTSTILTATNSTLQAGTTASEPNNIDTITTIIVPAKLLNKVVSDLKGQGLGIDNQYPFKSIRGGGGTAGGDKNQVLLVLTSSGKDLNEVTSALNKVVPTMQYK